MLEMMLPTTPKSRKKIRQGGVSEGIRSVHGQRKELAVILRPRYASSERLGNGTDAAE